MSNTIKKPLSQTFRESCSREILPEIKVFFFKCENWTVYYFGKNQTIKTPKNYELKLK